jgi:hypothetical protein
MPIGEGLRVERLLRAERDHRDLEARFDRGVPASRVNVAHARMITGAILHLACNSLGWGAQTQKYFRCASAGHDAADDKWLPMTKGRVRAATLCLVNPP